MLNCKRVTRSGAVYEIEYYPVSECVRDLSSSNPKPENIRTPEEKKRYNHHKSEKQFIRIINTNFTSSAYYVTLTYNNEHLPESYSEALKNAENYTRRLKYLNPNARICCPTRKPQKNDTQTAKNQPFFAFCVSKKPKFQIKNRYVG